MGWWDQGRSNVRPQDGRCHAGSKIAVSHATNWRVLWCFMCGWWQIECRSRFKLNHLMFLGTNQERPHPTSGCHWFRCESIVVVRFPRWCWLDHHTLSLWTPNKFAVEMTEIEFPSLQDRDAAAGEEDALGDGNGRWTYRDFEGFFSVKFGGHEIPGCGTPKRCFVDEFPSRGWFSGSRL